MKYIYRFQYFPLIKNHKYISGRTKAVQFCMSLWLSGLYKACNLKVRSLRIYRDSVIHPVLRHRAELIKSSVGVLEGLGDHCGLEQELARKTSSKCSWGNTNESMSP